MEGGHFITINYEFNWWAPKDIGSPVEDPTAKLKKIVSIYYVL